MAKHFLRVLKELSRNSVSDKNVLEEFREIKTFSEEQNRLFGQQTFIKRMTRGLPGGLVVKV